MNLKQKIIKSITNKYIKNTVDSTRECPVYSTYSGVSSDIVNNMFKVGNIPSLGYRSYMLSDEYNNISMIIKSALEAISGDALNINKEYLSIINKYNILYNKINKQAFNINSEVSNLAGYNCFNINTGFSNQTEGSHSGRIGKFITLPFFTSTTRIYDGNATLSLSTTDEITFSNLDRITSLNFSEKPSIKILSNKDIIEYKITIKLEYPIYSNLIYIKFLNNIQNINISTIRNGTTKSSYNSQSNEILFNFNREEIDSISIVATTINSNTDKPTSIQIDSINIFTNIKFSKSGIFESKQNLVNVDDFNFISLSSNNTNKSQEINVDQLISISSDTNIRNYMKTYNDSDIDVSSHKLINSITFNEQDITIKNINGKEYKTIEILDTSENWGIDYLNSIIVYGVSDKYLSQDNIDINSRYSNWYENGNYFITNILNYENDISINTGDIEVIFNGKSISGIINIPFGISTISVHKKDIDISRDRNLKLSYDNDILGIISGLPIYNNDGTLANKINKQALIDKQSDIFLGSAFIPFTETVTDNNGYVYRLSLSRSPNKPGTYTIEPNIGKINVWPIYNGNLITIECYKAQQDKRPAGLLFNRQLRYKPLSYLMNNDDEFSFSVFGNSTSHNIVLPKIYDTIPSSQILFNNKDQKMFISTKLIMESNNIYLSPTVSNISITVK